MPPVRPVNVRFTGTVPPVVVLTGPGTLMLPALAEPSCHEKSVKLALGPLVLNPCTYTVYVPAGGSVNVTISFESPSAACPTRDPPRYTYTSRSVPEGVINPSSIPTRNSFKPAGTT